MSHPWRYVCWNLLAMLALLLSASNVTHAWEVKVINMTPPSLSGETNQDSEPNLAVNPANPNQIAGSAFTPGQGFCGPNLAPIYVSIDSGNTWALNCIVPSQTGSLTGTGDITVRFSATTNNLYAGILRQPGSLRLNILRTNNFTGPAAMTVLVDRNNVDQPYVQATTVTGSDRVYVGDNDLAFSTFLFGPGVSGQTATIDQSVNANAACCPPPPPPPTFTSIRIERRTTAGQDGPPIRPAIHPDGTIYGIFYGWRAFSGSAATADVVVIRDDVGGTGPSPFTALVDPGDGLAGMRVVQNITVPWANFSQPGFCQERFVGSNISIAVDPRNSSTVYIAWADQVGTTYTLHVRRSLDRGLTWSTDLRTITTATNPALAINSNGTVGFLYQQCTGTGAAQQWGTHLELTNDAFETIQDFVLANVSANMPAPVFTPYIGDYVHLMAVASTFYGIFSANNTPNIANFPNRVTYQRNANFATNTLLNLDRVTPVAASIDPFFVKVSEISIDPCRLHPWLCGVADLERDLIILRCPFRECFAIDPIPRNCLVKFGGRCPGCPPGPGALCPPYYHVFFDGLDDVWDVGLFDAKGNLVPHQQFKTPTGIVMSFRPGKEDYIEGQIGDYFLAFKMGPEGKPEVEYKVKVRVERSEQPYKQAGQR
jgi:hypothetical protein